MKAKLIAKSFAAMIAAAAVLLAPRIAGADTFSLTLRQGGVAGTMGGIPIPMKASLGPGKLIGVKKEPKDLVDPLYASFDMGPQGQKTTFCLILDEVPGKLPRLIVDANHNGDLTDDPPVVWRQVEYFDFKGNRLQRQEGSVMVQVPYGKSNVPLKVVFQRLDPGDPNFAAFQDVIIYMTDYVREGTIKLGGDTYNVSLLDIVANGDFRGNFRKDLSGTMLLIDVNGNGRIDGPSEMYDIAQPFNIKGTTYELHVLTPDGSKLEVVKSKRMVREILPPPDLRAGKPALPFTCNTYKLFDGKTVHFPDDYKGKLVLLYFWAEWCPTCINEMPNVQRAYAAYHSRGVEILGVSIEPEEKEQKFVDYVQTNKLPWPETFDGKFFQGDLAQLYNVLETPTPFLIDGDTGKILATRGDLLGPALSKTLDKFLTERKH